MDTLERIKQLLTAQGWTKYKLAKESGLAQSTIINIFNHNTIPSRLGVFFNAPKK